ncbi:MAG TPA: MFS transporter [Gaiellaceae bacterium]|nr:MFS transporter [Gaiellaceae bacterium]
MKGQRRFELGALAERDFRLLFTATTITTIGDRLAVIALAFAVLDFGGATDLGIVLAARQGVNALVFLVGGVISDRLPRNLVLVGASLVQGAAQAATAALVLGGHASVLWLVVLQGVYGVGEGLVVPAEIGLVPQTVSPERLQQANALQGMTRDVTRVLGPAVGAAIVVAASPGVALAADAASFVLCALILLGIRIAPRVGGPERETFWHELRAGWREFTARTWLWSAVLIYGLGNFSWAAWSVLGPVVAKNDLGGAGAWGAILAAGGVGSVAGGLFALRIRPERPLAVSVAFSTLPALQFATLAAAAPVWAIAAAAFVAGLGLSVHLALWFTVFQQQVPEHAQSRVSSYDALGSFVLLPIGAAVVGPIAAAVGVHTTLWGAGAFALACCLAVLALPSVWAIRAAPEAAAAV